MTLKKTLLVALFAATATLLVACGASNKQTSSDAWDSYKQKKTITLGFDNTLCQWAIRTSQEKIPALILS